MSGWRVGRRRQAASADRVRSRLAGLGRGSTGRPATRRAEGGRVGLLDRVGQHRRALVGAEEVGPDPGHHEPVEALGVGRGQHQQRAGPEREPDGVHRLVGEWPRGPAPRAGRRPAGSWGLARVAVAEQVDGRPPCARCPQQVEPAALAPGAGARAGEPVHQHDGRGHRGGRIVGGHGADTNQPSDRARAPGTIPAWRPPTRSCRSSPGCVIPLDELSRPVQPERRPGRPARQPIQHPRSSCASTWSPRRR